MYVPNVFRITFLSTQRRLTTKPIKCCYSDNFDCKLINYEEIKIIISGK